MKVEYLAILDNCFSQNGFFFETGLLQNFHRGNVVFEYSGINTHDR